MEDRCEWIGFTWESPSLEGWEQGLDERGKRAVLYDDCVLHQGRYAADEPLFTGHTAYEQDWRNRSLIHLRPKVQIKCMFVFSRDQPAGRTLYLRLPHPQVADLTVTDKAIIQSLDFGIMFVRRLMERSLDSEPSNMSFPFSEHNLKLRAEAAVQSGRNGKSFSYGLTNNAQRQVILRLQEVQKKLNRQFSVQSLPLAIQKLANRAMVTAVAESDIPHMPLPGTYFGSGADVLRHALSVLQSDAGLAGGRKPGRPITPAQAKATKTMQAARVRMLAWRSPKLMKSTRPFACVG